MKKIFLTSFLVVLVVTYHVQLLVAQDNKDKKDDKKTSKDEKKDEDKKKKDDDGVQCIAGQKNLHDLVVMYRRIAVLEEKMDNTVAVVTAERNATKLELNKTAERVIAFEKEVKANHTKLDKRVERLENETFKGSKVSRETYAIMCYYDDFQVKGEATFLPESLDPKLCTDIIYNSVLIDPKSLQITAKNPKLDVKNKFYRRVTNLKKKHPKLRVYLSLGSWAFENNLYSKIIADPKLRKTFASHAVYFLRDYNFDGLNLLWSFPACGLKPCSSNPKTDKINFISFLADLRESFDGVQPPLLLTARVAAFPDVVSQVYNAPSMAKLLDAIHVETPFYCPRWNVTCHSSPLFTPNQTLVGLPPVSVDESVQHWINLGVPPKKIIMTVEAYGRKFALENPSHHTLGAPSKGRQGNPRFKEICELLRRPDWNIVYDASIGMTYAHKGNQWIAYEDPVSLSQKAEYVKSMDLGGIALQNPQYDDQGASCCNTSYPLLNVARNVLLGSGVALNDMDCPIAILT